MVNSIGCRLQITVKQRAFPQVFPHGSILPRSPEKQEVFLVRRNIGQAPYLLSGFLRKLGGNCQTS